MNLYNVPYKTASEIDVQRLNPTLDIQPVSEFRANAAKFIEQVRETRKPLVLTQHGRGAVVMLDLESYHALIDELAVQRAFEDSEQSIREGKGVPHEDVMKELRARLGV